MKKEHLHNVQSTGFKTPDTYFESLESAVFSKLKEGKQTFDVNSSGFKVPVDYFEFLDEKILISVNEKETPKVITIFNWKKIAYISGIAASLIVVFNLIFTKTDPLTFDDLETTYIETYLLNEDLNMYEMAPYFDTSQINTDDFVEQTLNTSDIEDYLLQNSDVESLITD